MTVHIMQRYIEKSQAMYTKLYRSNERSNLKKVIKESFEVKAPHRLTNRINYQSL